MNIKQVRLSKSRVVYDGARLTKTPTAPGGLVVVVVY